MKTIFALLLIVLLVFGLKANTNTQPQLSVCIQDTDRDAQLYIIAKHNQGYTLKSIVAYNTTSHASQFLIVMEKVVQ